METLSKIFGWAVGIFMVFALTGMVIIAIKWVIAVIQNIINLF